MMNKRSKLATLLLLLIAFAGICVYYFSHHPVAVLDPKGPIALHERNLIYFTLALCMVVVIPVFVLTIVFAWRYRESNHKARYSPNLDHNSAAEAAWWLIPTIIIAILSVVTWRSSHSLDPFRPIDTTKRPLSIQVVAMDWKWLFIYPRQNIASVNYFQIPVNTPVDFEITSDAPMNSFWIPQLGGQIYAMAGMATHLHLEATNTGTYNGSSANISGQGFAGMSFTATASSRTDFQKWIQLVKTTGTPLNLASYNRLAQPSSNDPVAYYSSEQPDLFGNVLARFTVPGMEGYVQ